MADLILIRAINGKTKSKPIKVYRTSTDIDLPAQFVLRLDTMINNMGEEQLRISNSAINLIASHNPDWLTEALTGFRRDHHDQTYIIAERFRDDIPQIKSLAKEETY